MSNNGGSTEIKLLVPQSAEAEDAVLGSLILNPQVYYDVKMNMRKEDLSLLENQWIFQAIEELHRRGEPVDLLTLAAELTTMGKLDKVGGYSRLALLDSKAPSSLNADGYARIVSRLATRRGLIEAAKAIVHIARSDNPDIDVVVQRAESALLEVTDRNARPELLSIRQVGEESADRQLRIMSSNPDETIYLPTGWSSVDQMTDQQIEMGRLVQLVGESGHGKSTAAAQMAANWARLAAEPKAPHGWVLYCTIEMTPVNLHDRMVAALSDVSMNAMKRNTITDAQRNTWNRTADTLQKWPLYIVGKRVGISDAGRYANVLTKKFGKPGVIIFDTANKVQGAYSRTGLYEGLSQISNQMDALKLDGHLVMGLVQHRIEREATLDPNKLRPRAGTLEGTGKWYQDADVVFFVYRADEHTRRIGPQFKDDTCPKGKILMEKIKLRDGDTNTIPALLDWASTIPAIRDARPKGIK